MLRENLKLGCVAEMLRRFGNWSFIVVFSVVYIRILWKTTQVVPGSVGKYIFLALAWVALLGYLSLRRARLPKEKHIQYTVIAFLLSQFVYVWAIHSQVSSDAYVIAYIAYHFAAGEFDALEGWWMDYLAVYPNNLPATEVVALVFSVWLPDTLEQAWLLLSGVAALLSDLALVFIYKLVRNAVSKTAAVAAVLMAVATITLSEPSTILYSDIMALWATPAALYALYCGKTRNGKYYAVAGILLAYGAWIKPQSVVLTIAVCIGVTLECFQTCKWQQKQTIRSGVLGVIAFLVTTACLFGIKNAAIDLVGKDRVEQNEMPAIHFVSMGLNPETNGCYSEKDVLEMEAVLGHDAKVELAKSKIKLRLEELGAYGLLKHIDNKIVLGAGNGTFTSALEWRGAVQNHSLQAQRIQRWSVFAGENFSRYTAPWIQCVYLLMFAMSICSAVFSVSKRYREADKAVMLLADICRYFMVGVLLMLIFLERNLRYVYAALPCMIFLAAYILEKVSVLFEKKKTVAQK